MFQFREVADDGGTISARKFVRCFNGAWSVDYPRCPRPGYALRVVLPNDLVARERDFSLVGVKIYVDRECATEVGSQFKLNHFITPGYEDFPGGNLTGVFDNDRRTMWAPEWDRIGLGEKLYVGVVRPVSDEEYAAKGPNFVDGLPFLCVGTYHSTNRDWEPLTLRVEEWRGKAGWVKVLESSTLLGGVWNHMRRPGCSRLVDAQMHAALRARAAEEAEASSGGNAAGPSTAGGAGEASGATGGGTGSNAGVADKGWTAMGASGLVVLDDRYRIRDEMGGLLSVGSRRAIECAEGYSAVDVARTGGPISTEIDLGSIGASSAAGSRRALATMVDASAGLEDGGESGPEDAEIETGSASAGRTAAAAPSPAGSYHHESGGEDQKQPRRRNSNDDVFERETMECLANGVWSSAKALVCAKSCTHYYPTDMRFFVAGMGYRHGDVKRVMCSDGYQPVVWGTGAGSGSGARALRAEDEKVISAGGGSGSIDDRRGATVGTDDATARENVSSEYDGVDGADGTDAAGVRGLQSRAGAGGEPVTLEGSDLYPQMARCSHGSWEPVRFDCVSIASLLPTPASTAVASCGICGLGVLGITVLPLLLAAVRWNKDIGTNSFSTGNVEEVPLASEKQLQKQTIKLKLSPNMPADPAIMALKGANKQREKKAPASNEDRFDRVVFLGTGSAVPCPGKRNMSSLLVTLTNGAAVMVDCGEGTQHQLKVCTRAKATKLEAIFITHLHGDHCYGLFGLILTCGTDGRTAPLTIVGPEGIKDMPTDVPYVQEVIPIAKKMLQVMQVLALSGGWADYYPLRFVEIPTRRWREQREVPLDLEAMAVPVTASTYPPAQGEWPPPEFQPPQVLAAADGLSSVGNNVGGTDMEVTDATSALSAGGVASNNDGNARGSNVNYFSGGTGANGPANAAEVAGKAKADEPPTTVVANTSLRKLKLTAVPLVHGMVCWGYVLEEPAKPGKLDMARCQALGVPPGALLGKLKRGEDVEFAPNQNKNKAQQQGKKKGKNAAPVAGDGSSAAAAGAEASEQPQAAATVVVRASDVMAPGVPGRKIAVLQDSSDSSAACRQPCIQGCDLFVHECTFERSMKAEAILKGHSTSEMAAEFANACGAKQLVLTHFSARYTESSSGSNVKPPTAAAGLDGPSPVSGGVAGTSNTKELELVRRMESGGCKRAGDGDTGDEGSSAKKLRGAEPGDGDASSSAAAVTGVSDTNLASVRRFLAQCECCGKEQHFSVSAEANDGDECLMVVDDGAGAPPKFLPKGISNNALKVPPQKAAAAAPAPATSSGAGSNVELASTDPAELILGAEAREVFKGELGVLVARDFLLLEGPEWRASEELCCKRNPFLR
eukprot:gene127-120_t